MDLYRYFVGGGGQIDLGDISEGRNEKRRKRGSCCVDKFEKIRVSSQYTYIFINHLLSR